MVAVDMVDQNRLESEILSEQQLAELEAYCAEYEQQWRGDDEPSLEEALRPLAEPMGGALFRRLLSIEVLARMKRGQTPQADEYEARFSDHHSTISAVFAELLPQSVTIAHVDYQKARGHGPNFATTVGAYEVLERLGHGGMGVVYKALDPRLKRVVAIKMMLAAEHAGEEEVARFRLEAEAVARLQHSNIVQIYEVGEHEGRPYISLEFVDGPNATQFVGAEPQPSRLAAELVQSLAAAMHYAHAQGIVHRDLKPANILLARQQEEDSSASSSSTKSLPGDTASSTKTQAAEANTAVALSGSSSTARMHLSRDDAALSLSHRSSASRGSAAATSSGWIPKITDFGLAKQLDAQSELTTSGAIVGTPQYMAPEQASGATNEIGPLADVYSLGAILYFMITGRPPFLGSSALETMMMVRNVNAPPPTLLIPQLSKDLETICLKCLEKDPARRYESAGALADELGRFLRGEPILARPVGRLERTRRWCRRNPLPASLAAACLITFVMGFIGVTWKWREASANFFAADAAKKLAIIKQGDAERSEKEAQKERNAALQAKLALQRQSSHLLFQRGIEFCDRGKAERGVLWLAESLKTAPDSDEDYGWRQVIRTNLQGWRDHIDVLEHRIRADRSMYARAISSDSKTLVIGGIEGAIVRYDLDTGKQIGETSHIDISQSGWASIWALAYHPSENWFFAGAGLQATGEGPGNGILQRFDGESGDPIRDPIHLPVSVQQIVFSPHGEYYAIVLADKFDAALTVRRTSDDATLLEPITGKIGGSEFRDIAFNSDGTRMKYVRDNDAKQKRTIVLETERWTEIDEPHETLAFAPPLSEVAKWDALYDTWRHLQSPDRSRAMVAIERDAGVRRRSRGHLNIRPMVEFSPEVQKFSWHYFVDLCPDGEKVLLGSQDGTALISNARTGEWLVDPLHQPGRILTVAFSPDGNLAVTCATDAQFWDAESGQPVGEPLKIGATISVCQFSPDGKKVAIGDYASRVTLWDVHSRQMILPPLRQGDIVTKIAFSPDGNRLLVGTASDWNHDPQAVLWDLELRQPVGAPMKHSHYVRHVQFSSDGNRMLTASSDATLKLWNAHTAESIGATIPYTREFTPAQFTPDGELVVTGTGAGEIRAWDAHTGKPIPNAVFKGPALPSALAFTPDGSRFVVGYRNGASRVFDAAAFRPLTPFTSQNGVIKQVRLSPSGDEWTSITEHGESRVWQVSRSMQGEPETIVKRLQVDTGYCIDANQMQTKLTLEQWRREKQDLLGERFDPPSTSDAQWHDAIAKNAEQEGNWLVALWRLEQLVAAEPENWLAHARLARCHSQLGRVEIAGEHYDRVADQLNAQPEKLYRWYQKLVKESREASDWGRAKWHLDRLLAAKPDDWRLLAERATVARESGDTENYLTDRKQVLQQADDQAVLLSFVDELAEEADWAQIAAVYERASLLGAFSLQHWRQFSLSLIKNNQPDEFRDVCHTLLESLAERDLPPGVVNQLGWLCAMGPVEPEDSKRAISMLEKLLEATPESAWQKRSAYLNTLGGLHLRAQDPEQAVRRLKESIEVHEQGGGGAGWTLLAIAHHQLGESDMAEEWREKAAAYDRKAADTWDRLELDLLWEEVSTSLANPQE